MFSNKEVARLASFTAILLAVCTLLGCAKVEKAPQSGDVASPIATDSPAIKATPIESPSVTPAPSDDAWVEACFSKPEGALRHQYTVSLETDGENLRGQMQLQYYNDAQKALEEIWLHIYPNAVEPGCFTLDEVNFGGVKAAYKLENDATLLCVPLARALLPGECVTFALRFSMAIPQRADRLGRSGNTVALGNFLPIAAVYEEGGWRKDAYSFIGDAFYSSVSDYTVTFRAPEGYVLAATGDMLSEETEGGMTTTKLSASKVREFAAVLTQGAEYWALSGPDDVTVRSVAGSKANIEFMGVSVVRAMTYFTEQIGAYPYGHISIAPCDMLGAGMEYPGLMLISTWYLDTERRDIAELVVAHETAHQWWYAVVGTDQVQEPWVDEALCEFLSFDYIRSTYGEAAYSALYKQRFSGMAEGGAPLVKLNSPLSAFDENTYFESVYAYGCSMYRELYEKIGHDAFYGALRTLYAERSFEKISGEALISAFSRAAQQDLSGWFEERLNAQRGE